MLPQVVLIPQYIIFRSLNLTNTYTSDPAGMVFSSVLVFMMMQFIHGLPWFLMRQQSLTDAPVFGLLPCHPAFNCRPDHHGDYHPTGFGILYNLRFHLSRPLNSVSLAIKLLADSTS